MSDKAPAPVGAPQSKTNYPVVVGACYGPPPIVAEIRDRRRLSGGSSSQRSQRQLIPTLIPAPAASVFWLLFGSLDCGKLPSRDLTASASRRDLRLRASRRRLYSRIRKPIWKSARPDG